MKKMRNRLYYWADKLLYWSIILLPVGMAMGNAPMNIFTGFLLFGFIVRQAAAARTGGGWPLRLKTPVTGIFALFIVISVFSLVNSADLSDSVRGLFKLGKYLLLFSIMAHHIKDERHLRRIVGAVAAGVLLVSADAHWQVIFGADFLRGYAPIVNIGLKRATASFTDANLLGIYLSAFIPVLAGVALYQSKGTLRLAMGGVSLLALSAALLTFSRPTFLALYVVFLALAVVKKTKVLVILLLLSALVTPFLLPESVREWGRSVEYDPVRFMCNDDRIAAYRNTLGMIREHPVVGVGVNTFMKQYRYYKESPEYRGVVTSDYMYAHNNFLHMAGESGLAGFGVFLWFVFALFQGAADARRTDRDPRARDMILFVMMGLVSFLINGLTESSLYYSRVALIFWYLTGVLLSLTSLRYHAQEA